MARNANLWKHEACWLASTRMLSLLAGQRVQTRSACYGLTVGLREAKHVVCQPLTHTVDEVIGMPQLLRVSLLTSVSLVAGGSLA